MGFYQQIKLRPHFRHSNAWLYVRLGSSAAYRYVVSLATAIAREPAIQLEIIKPLYPDRQLLLRAVVQTVNTSPARFAAISRHEWCESRRIFPGTNRQLPKLTVPTCLATDNLLALPESNPFPRENGD